MTVMKSPEDVLATGFLPEKKAYRRHGQQNMMQEVDHSMLSPYPVHAHVEVAADQALAA